MGDAAQWLKENSNAACTITLFNGTPLSVTPPNFVELQIVETDPGVRGDTSGGGGKPARLETGRLYVYHFLYNKKKSLRWILVQANICLVYDPNVYPFIKKRQSKQIVFFMVHTKYTELFNIIKVIGIKCGFLGGISCYCGI